MRDFFTGLFHFLRYGFETLYRPLVKGLGGSGRPLQFGHVAASHGRDGSSQGVFDGVVGILRDIVDNPGFRAHRFRKFVNALADSLGKGVHTTGAGSLNGPSRRGRGLQLAVDVHDLIHGLISDLDFPLAPGYLFGQAFQPPGHAVEFHSSFYKCRP